MVSLETILNRKKEASGLASSQTRTLALGFIAISWALLTAHDEPLKTMTSGVNRYLLLGLALLGVLVIACDLLQYLAVTAMTNEAARRAERNSRHEAQYDRNSLAYRSQAFFFWGKMCLLGGGSAVLVTIFALLFFSSATHQVSPANLRTAPATYRHDADSGRVVTDSY